MTDFQLTPPYRNEIDTQMPWDDYVPAVGVNPSRIGKGLKSMLAFRNYHGTDKPDRGMLVGSLTHLLIFEPDKFDERYAVFHGHQRRGEKYEMWKWKYPGKEAVKPDVYEQAQRTAEAVRRDPQAMEIINATQHEVSVFCEDFGVQCKGRLDGLGSGLLPDLKTTTNVDKFAFGRVFGSQNYAAKLACYKRWAEKLGVRVDEVQIIAVENANDFDVVVYPVPQIVLENAWARVEKILKRIPECVERDEWPGVSEGQVGELHIPNWSMPEDEVLEW